MMMRILNTFQKNNFWALLKDFPWNLMGNIWVPKAFLVLISMKVYKCILKTLFASEKYFFKWLLIQCSC
jgi:hypothetical protein